MEKKKQTMRFTDTELSIMKNTFAENMELLMAVRRVFLQMPLSEADKAVLSVFKGNEALMDLMYKTFNPQLDGEAPLHQMIDLWMSVDIKEKSVEDLMPVFASRQLLIDLLDQQLEALEAVAKGEKFLGNIAMDSLVVLDNKTPEEFYIGLVARNTIISHVDSQIAQIEVLAGLKDETVEKTLEKLKKNSSR